VFVGVVGALATSPQFLSWHGEPNGQAPPSHSRKCMWMQLHNCLLSKAKTRQLSDFDIFINAYLVRSLSAYAQCSVSPSNAFLPIREELVLEDDCAKVGPGMQCSTPNDAV
jgi:hypothetical protein